MNTRGDPVSFVMEDGVLLRGPGDIAPTPAPIWVLGLTGEMVTALSPPWSQPVCDTDMSVQILGCPPGIFESQPSEFRRVHISVCVNA